MADTQRKEESPPTWEWAVAGIGTVLLVGTLGFLAYEALQSDDGPPVPRVRVTSVDAHPSGFVARFSVENESRATAGNLRITGVLLQDGKEVERSATEFLFVPGRSAREGGLFFRRDPRLHALEVRPESYQKP
jgi:uncharacterized protein (TIGR02588 family)